MRDEKGRFAKGNVSGKQFRTADERRIAAGKASGAARREKGDLKKLLRLWMETEVDTDKDGNPITGAEMMLRVAVKEMKKGNYKFWELLRDTAGFKPIDRVAVSQVDQAVIDEVESLVIEAERMNEDD